MQFQAREHIKLYSHIFYIYIKIHTHFKLQSRPKKSEIISNFIEQNEEKQHCEQKYDKNIGSENSKISYLNAPHIFFAIGSGVFSLFSFLSPSLSLNLYDISKIGWYRTHIQQLDTANFMIYCKKHSIHRAYDIQLLYCVLCLIKYIFLSINVLYT